MAPGEYASAGAGKLKLKGVKDSKVDKKKKKKSSKPSKDDAEANVPAEDAFHDKSVVLKKFEEEDAKLAAEHDREDRVEVDAKTEEEQEVVKTEAERRYEEQRRRRVGSHFLPYFLPLRQSIRI